MIQKNDIITCPDCGSPMDISQLRPFTLAQCPTCKSLHRVHTRLGVYEITDKLGMGGMSIVFQATDMVLGRDVALKILNETYYDKPERVARFEKESALMAKVHHPHVVNVYSIGQALNHLYIAMELISGTDIETLIAQRGRITERETLDIALQVTEGLFAAQKAGLLHRDMKPANILLTTKGEAKIVDFGLALLQSDQDTEKEVWVTPFYAPPETLNRTQEDLRADIYALGATMFHMLVGRPPLAAGINSIRKLLDLKKKIPKLQTLAPEISRPTCDIVNRMMSFSMNQRPQSYQELISELTEARSICTARESGDKQSLRALFFRRYKRKKIKHILIGFTGLILLLIGLLLLLPNRTQPPGEKGVDGTPSGMPPIKHTQQNQLNEAEQALLDKNFVKASEAFHTAFSANQDDSALSAWSALHASLCQWISGPGKLQSGLDMLNQLKQSETIRKSDRESTHYILSLSETLLSPDWQTQTPLFPVSDRMNLRAAAQLAIGLRHLNANQPETALEQLKKAQASYMADESSPAYKAYLPAINACIRDLETYTLFRNMPERNAEERQQKIAKGTALTKDMGTQQFQSPYRPYFVKQTQDECAKISSKAAPSDIEAAADNGIAILMKQAKPLLDKNEFAKARNIFTNSLKKFSPQSSEYKILEAYASMADIASTCLQAIAGKFADGRTFTNHTVIDQNGRKFTVTGYANGQLIANRNGTPVTLAWKNIQDESLLQLFQTAIQGKATGSKSKIAQATDEFRAILQCLRHAGDNNPMPAAPAHSSKLFQSMWAEWKAALH